MNGKIRIERMVGKARGRDYEGEGWNDSESRSEITDRHIRDGSKREDNNVRELGIRGQAGG